MESLSKLRINWLIFISILLVSCGGGGGDNGPAGITYTGNTNQALLTADNDDVFGTTMLEGSAANKNSTPFFSINSNTSSSSKTHLGLLEALSQQFQQDIERAGLAQQTSALAAVAGVPDQPGTCGGTMSFNGNENSGSVVYSNYCVGFGSFQMTLNGTMSYTFEVNGANYRATLTYSGFTVTTKSGSDTWTQTASGSMTIVSQDGVISVTYSSLFERDGKVYKIENLTLKGGHIKGTLYHPDFGFVEIDTKLSDLFLLQPNGEYCGGTLQIVGVDGSGQSVSATMSVENDCSSYTITYKSQSETVVWH